MIKPVRTLALVFGFALASSAIVRTQEKPAAAAGSVTPLKIQVLISRYQGDKKISSLPYTLSVNSNREGEGNREGRTAGHATLRMGTKVPVMMMAPPSIDGKPLKDIPMAGPIQYQDVGTNIDCFVWPIDDARFRVEMTIDDSSVYPEEKEPAGASKGNPSFRSFRASDSMILKDGATAQFTVATDKVTGEIVKVDVTLTVVK